MTEEVILVDEKNNVLGTAPKDEVHTTNTPLHRGFSLFLFNSSGELLLTRRALTKKTFPGVWTNTVCGHPSLGESEVDAAKRRLNEELGIDLDKRPDKRSDLKVFQGLTLMETHVVSPYRYRFADKNGIVENEICPILIGYFDGDPNSNPQEVSDWKWINWHAFLMEIENDTADIYSPWCKEEAHILQKKINRLDKRNSVN